ncbi:MAG: hypothetical protein ACXVJW_17340, partial [Acidimicrobiia bacterium]
PAGPGPSTPSPPRSTVHNQRRVGAERHERPLSPPCNREPGDSLWSAAHHLAPGSDPREVIDALTKVRGDGPLRPGEILRWQR